MEKRTEKLAVSSAAKTAGKRSFSERTERCQILARENSIEWLATKSGPVENFPFSGRRRSAAKFWLEKRAEKLGASLGSKNLENGPLLLHGVGIFYDNIFMGFI